MFKWTSAFHIQLLFSTLMEPSYTSSEKHRRAELLVHTVTSKHCSLELQLYESLGAFLMEIPAFSLQVTPKVFEPANTNFWKEENLQSTWTQNVKVKVAEPEKRICHCGSQGTESQEGIQEHRKQWTLNF